MKLDFGVVVVIVSVLIFYLRLIGAQREHLRRTNSAHVAMRKTSGKRDRPAAADAPTLPEARYTFLSARRRDRLIGAAGAALIGLGVLFHLAWLPPAALHPVWWLFVSAGVIAFSWLFHV